MLSLVSELPEHLGFGRKVPMFPDLAFFAYCELVYVGEVKYKLTGSGMARNADYYQLLAYATALDQQEGLLVYCQADGTVPDREVVVRHTTTSLRTHALDLSGSPAEMEASIGALSELIWEGVVRARATARDRKSTRPN